MRERGIRSQIVLVAEVTPADARAMYQIFARHYDCVSLEQFLFGLSEKDCVLLLRNLEGVIGDHVSKQRCVALERDAI